MLSAIFTVHTQDSTHFVQYVFCLCTHGMFEQRMNTFLLVHNIYSSDGLPIKQFAFFYFLSSVSFFFLLLLFHSIFYRLVLFISIFRYFYRITFISLSLSFSLDNALSTKISFSLFWLFLRFLYCMLFFVFVEAVLKKRHRAPPQIQLHTYTIF